ncbi:MAG: aldo/keto reductase [Myxococcota bacterium]|nr:aldo/keto reductase [Myxococcota bacterium]
MAFALEDTGRNGQIPGDKRAARNARGASVHSNASCMAYRPMTTSRSRRQFLAATAAGATLAFSGCARAKPPPGAVSGGPRDAPIPKRPLGATGVRVSILGLGGAHLAQADDPKDGVRIVHEAIDAGVDFFDNAWEYHDGKSEEILGQALQGGRRDKVFVMTKVCTHGRKADVAMQQLEDSLRRLGTDHLDLWQIHECIYDNDPDLHFAPGGVVEALARAKQQGKTRFVGFTGHKHPSIHLRMLERMDANAFPFDTVQMPLNCFDGSFRSFEQQVVPAAVKRGIAPIGMKSLSGAGDPVRRGLVTVEEALRYAMSVVGVAVTVTGVDGLDILRQNLAIARGFEPMRPEDMQALRERVRPAAADGRLELYKTTTHYDAKIGREQHGYPSKEELPL